MVEQQVIFSGKEITSREPRPTLLDSTYMVPLSEISGFTSVPLGEEERKKKTRYIPGRDDPAYLETTSGRRFVLAEPLDRTKEMLAGSRYDFFINLVTTVTTFRNEVPKIPAEKGSEKLKERMALRIEGLNPKG